MAACDVYLNYPDRFSSEMAGTQRGYGTPSFHEEMMFTPMRHGSKSVGGSSSDLSASSRKSEMLQEYFKSTSALNRSIMTEKTLVEKEHMHWSVLSESRRDEIVDQHFVPEDVRLQYEGSLMEGPTYAWSNRLQKTSDQKYYTQSQSTLDDWDTSESIDGVSLQPLSQPADVKSTRKAKSVKDSTRLNEDTAPSSPQMFVRNKLRSFSSRSKKGMRLTKSRSPGNGTEIADEIIPLFERDVHELVNDVDLPDDSLLRDHIDDQENDPSFARLKPLRYSFGRKLRHKVDQGSNGDLSNNQYILYNQGINSLSMQDLQMGMDDNLCSSSPDIAIINTSPEPEMTDSHVLATSPPSVISDDHPSCVSPSRQSALTPDSAQNMRCKSRNLESPLKHPLIRSTRAGSSYMTVTSQFADRRQQLKASSVRRKVNSAVATEETTSTVSPLESQITSPPAAGVPMTKVSSTSDSMVTDSTNSSDPISPINSPPPSPYHRTNRESGYMSSTYASDEEEMPKPKPVQHRQKRRSRNLVVERSAVNPRH